MERGVELQLFVAMRFNVSLANSCDEFYSTLCEWVSPDPLCQLMLDV